MRHREEDAFPTHRSSTQRMDHFPCAFPHHSFRVDAGDQIHFSYRSCQRLRAAADDPRCLGSLASRPRVARLGFAEMENLHRLARHRDVRR